MAQLSVRLEEVENVLKRSAKGASTPDVKLEDDAKTLYENLRAVNECKSELDLLIALSLQQGQDISKNARAQEVKTQLLQFHKVGQALETEYGINHFFRG